MLGLKPARIGTLNADRPAFVSESPTDTWRDFTTSRGLSISPRRVFNARDRFFTIGSCFVEEIRKALTARGITCLPDYSCISFDSSLAIVDTLPERPHMNYYNTFSILQEFERAAGLWEQSDDDCWSIEGHRIGIRNIRDGRGRVFQDPYRRNLFGATREILLDARRQVDAAMVAGMRSATVFIITLGMTEVFLKTGSGQAVNQYPVKLGARRAATETEFHASTFAENLQNMRRTVALARALTPAAKIVVTVSPVPMNRTFTGKDVVVANLKSKATLLAVAHELCDEDDGLFYFPSYEIVTGIGPSAYKETDARHVRPEIVDKIIGSFSDAMFERESAA